MAVKDQQNKVDLLVADLLPKLKATQDKWFAGKKEYFQGLPSHTEKPKDGADTLPTNLAAKPTDRNASWNDFLASSDLAITIAAIPAALTQDVYQGPKGWGWSLSADFEYEKRLYRRTWNTGPETWRNMAWSDVTPAKVAP